MTVTSKDKLDKLVAKIQVGALYAENTEPATTNQRKIYVKQLKALFIELANADGLMVHTDPEKKLWAEGWTEACKHIVKKIEDL